MFTLIRPVAALLLAIFAAYCAKVYEPLYGPEADLGSFPLWAAAVCFAVGWAFVGNGIGRSWWFSIYLGVQGVALGAVATAMLIAVREVFVLGYRRRYGEVMEAFTGYFDIVVGYLTKALVQDFLILLAAGGAVIGLLLHIVWAMMEKRRNDR